MARYTRLATRFSAALVGGLVLAALAGHSSSARLVRQGADRGIALLQQAGLASPGSSDHSPLLVDVALSTSRPYVLPNLQGEAFDFGGLVLRTLLPHAASDGLISIMGVNSGPAPLALAHYHAEAEAFYALKGSVEVFHNQDQGREIRANDFVFLAPKNVHSYRPVDLDFQLTLCMTPGGIDDFFRAAAAPFAKSAPFDPVHFTQPSPATVLGLMPKHNITPKLGYQVNLNWTNGTTEDGLSTWHRGPQTLPVDANTAYFVSSNRGPKFLHTKTRQVVARLATTTQSRGLLSVSTIALPRGTRPSSTLVFESFHAFQVTEGQLHLEMDGSTARLIFGDFAFIPKGTPFRYWSEVGFTKFVVWSTGDGLVERLAEGSEEWNHGVWST